MLYHTCKEHGEVYIDLSNRMRLLARCIGIRPDGIKPSSIIMQNTEKVVEPQFYCVSCEHPIPLQEIVCKCQMCGNDFSLDGVYKISEVGGIYCKSCSETYYKDFRKYVMSKIISKFS